MAIDLVKEFRSAYEAILADAERSEETTKTDAWHAMYHSFAEATKKEALDIATGLDEVASMARAMLVNSDACDLLAKLKKRFGELQLQINAFRASTINPIKEPFDKAAECVMDFQGRAASAANADGMFAKNIEDNMADAIAAQPKIQWNEKVGCLRIVPATPVKG